MSFDKARELVVATCRVLADRGFLAGTGGNVAYRIDDIHFAVTPSATDYYLMQAEDICVLRLDDLTKVAGDQKPSVEHRLHAHLLRLRKDANASIHTHQPIASAYTLLGRPLEIRDEAQRAQLGERAAYVGYAPSGTSWLAWRLKQAIRPEIHAYLMRNHGVVCCGATMRQAINRVEALEQVSANFFLDAIHSRGSIPQGIQSLLKSPKHLSSENLESAK
jgi:L-fuculose-phosphate aldolase